MFWYFACNTSTYYAAVGKSLMIKPLNPPMIEHLHTLALEDLAHRRNMSDGTWNNLIGGADSAFIVNYIDDVTKAYRSHQAKHALTYRPQTKPNEERALYDAGRDERFYKALRDKPADTSSSPLPSVQGRSYDRPFPFQPSGEFGLGQRRERRYLQL